jgi:hypothetical protein
MVHHHLLPILVVICTLVAGCTASPGIGSTATPTTTPEATTTPQPTRSPTATPTPATSAPGGDEPPIDLLPGPSTLGPDQPPHLVTIENDDGPERTVVLTVERNGTVVTERSFRSFPNTTVLTQLDEPGNYTLVVRVENRTAVETLSESGFDCNTSETTFDVTDRTPTVSTVTTEMACGTDAG